MLTQSSRISLRSSYTSVANYEKLQKMQGDIIAKIMQLKSQKIELLQYLSNSIDKKYEIQSILIHELQKKKKKQDIAVLEQQYKPIVLKNIQLKREIEELNRKILEKSATTLGGAGVPPVKKNRAMSVHDLERSKKLNVSRSVHSKMRLDLQNSKHTKTQIITTDDQLIEQIIEQRKQNSAVEQLIRQQPRPDCQQQLIVLRSRFSILKKLLNQKQKVVNDERLTKTVMPIESSKIQSLQRSKKSGASSVRNKKQSMPLSSPQQFTTYNKQSDLKVQLKELLRYIQEEEEEKKLLYVELNQFVQEMQEIQEENQTIKKELESNQAV